MFVVAMNSRSRPNDYTKSGEYHKDSIKCPCGCDRVQDMKCSACNQIATGCSECHRRLTPCDCGEEARARHRRLTPLPQILPTVPLRSHLLEWEPCSCGSQEVRKMKCAECRQQAMGCIDCKLRLSRCACDEPSQICYGKERKVRQRAPESGSSTIDTTQSGKDTVDTDVVKKVLTKFLRKPAESKSHESHRSERISSLEQQLVALKKTKPLNCDGDDKQIRSLERQLQAMIKQNAELTESLRKCAQSRCMDKMGEINQIPNNNLIPNNNPILNCNPKPNCNQQSRLPLRQQLDQIQMALSLSDIVDLHRETQQGRSHNDISRRDICRSDGEGYLKGELVKTVQDMRDEIKEVKQLEKIRESERAPRFRRERKCDPEPKYRGESRFSQDERYSRDEKYSREPKWRRGNRRISLELDEVSISDIESEDDYYHGRYR